MQFNPYGGTAAQLAAMLVNAIPDASPETLTRLLREMDYRPLVEVGEEEAAELVRWAEQVKLIFIETDLQLRVKLANELLAAAASQPYISQHDGRPPHVHYAQVKAPLVARLRAYTAAGLAHALCDDADRIGQCARPGCGVVYVDTSRNGRRRFCSARCANRVHVAEHRHRNAR